MSCSILTPERLEALLAGTLAGSDRAAVAEHLGSPCEACVDALASVDGEKILAALSGRKAELSAAEADRMFDAAVPGPKAVAAKEPAAGLWERLVEWLGGSAWRPALGVAALLLVAVPVVLLSRAPVGGGYDGVKSGPGEPATNLQANLVGVVGARFNGRPFVSRRASQREQLKPGEVLLVRFRLTESAAVHLQISGPKASLGVWPDGRADTEPPPAPLPAGEHALVANAQVLSIQTQEYGSPVRVTLVASPEPFPKGFAFADPEARCKGCRVDVLEVLPPPEGVEPEESFR